MILIVYQSFIMNTKRTKEDHIVFIHSRLKKNNVSFEEMNHEGDKNMEIREELTV